MRSQLTLCVLLIAAATKAATITNIEPSVGGVNGNTRLTIEGTGFDIRGRSNDVYIGTGLAGVFCDPVPNECTAERIVCLTDPYKGSGPMELSVRSFGFLAACRISSGCFFEYSQVKTPEVENIHPEWLAVTKSDASTLITVSGNRFTQGDVTVGNFDFTMHLGEEERCELIGQVSYSSFLCGITSMRPGTLPVDISLGASGRATLSRQKALLLYPMLKGVSPSVGSIAGGTKVTITGTSFSEALGENVVTIHGAPCVVTGYSQDHLYCTSSAHAPATPATYDWATHAGKAKREVWYNLPGHDISETWHGKLAFLQPAETSMINSVSLAGLVCDNCAVRVTTHILADATGTYTFTANGDDHWELWLALDDTPIRRAQEEFNTSQVLDIQPFHRRRIAFGTHSDTRTVTASLVAGRRYWLQFWLKQGEGGIALRLTATGPSGAAFPLADGNIAYRPDWESPVKIVVRDMPAMHADECLAWGTCAFTYSAANIARVNSVTPSTAAPGQTVTIAGSGFDTSATQPAAASNCNPPKGCGGGGCECATLQECNQNDNVCSWNGGTGKCQQTTPQTVCDGWSNNEVTIGGQPCYVTAQSSTALECRLGFVTGAGTFPVFVAVEGKGLSLGTPLLTIAATIRKIDPTAGSVNGANSLTVLGHGFDAKDSVTSVTVGGNACPIESIDQFKAVCTIPAGTSGAKTVQLSTQSRIAYTADSLWTYSLPYVRPGTTQTGKPASIAPTISSLSGGTQVTINVPSITISPSSTTVVTFGTLPCRIIFALGNTVTCATAGTNTPVTVAGTITVTHGDSTVETATLPELRYRRSVTWVGDGRTASPYGGGRFHISWDGSAVPESAISISVFGQPCVTYDHRMTYGICTTGKKPTAAPTLPVLDTVTFAGDGNPLTDPLGHMAYSVGTRANGDGTVTIPAGAHYLMTKKTYSRPFVFRARVRPSKNLADAPRDASVVMRVCAPDRATSSSGYRAVVGADSTGKFALQSQWSTWKSSTAQFAEDTAFATVGLDKTRSLEYKIVASRRHIRFYVDNVLIMTQEDSGEQVGSVGFGFSSQDIVVGAFTIESLYPQSLQVNISNQPVYNPYDILWGDAPAITSISPRLIGLGVSVTVQGTAFGDSNYDLFALASATDVVTLDTPRLCRGSIQTNSRTSTRFFTCVAEAIPAGDFFVTLRNREGQGETALAATFQASIASVTPASIGAGGGLVTMVGAGFTGDISVTISGQPCEVHSAKTTQVVCIAPPGTGSGNRIAATVNGNDVSVCRACSLTYSGSVATVTNVAPTTIVAGDSITITGTGFPTTGTIYVWLGKARCWVWSQTATELKCSSQVVATAGAQAVLIDLPSNGGMPSFTASAPRAVSYTAGARSLSPNTGGALGGTLIKLRGGNLPTNAGATQVAGHTFSSTIESGWSNHGPNLRYCRDVSGTRRGMLGDWTQHFTEKTFTGLGGHAALRLTYELTVHSGTVYVSIDDSAPIELEDAECLQGNVCDADWTTTCLAKGSLLLPHSAASATIRFEARSSSHRWALAKYTLSTVAAVPHAVTVGGSACTFQYATEYEVACLTPAAPSTGSALPVVLSIGGTTHCPSCTFTFQTTKTPTPVRMAAVELPGVPAGATQVPQFATSHDNVNVTYSAAGAAVWTGAGGGDWARGVYSPLKLQSANGATVGVNWTLTDNTCQSMWGLTSQPWVRHYNNIDFALYHNGKQLEVYERGSHRATAATGVMPGDKLAVFYDSSCLCVRYNLNGVTVFQSAQPPRWPLYAQGSINSGNCGGVKDMMFLAPRADSRRVVIACDGCLAAGRSDSVSLNGAACLDAIVSNGIANCWVPPATAVIATPMAVQVSNDAAGVGANPSLTLATRVISAPQFTAGSTGGGHFLRFLGSGFSAATTSISIGGVGCAVTNGLSTETTTFQCTTGAMPAGSHAITATTGGAHDCISDLSVYNYATAAASSTCPPYVASASPAVSGISPTSVTTGTVITVTGSGLATAGAEVRVGGTLCALSGTATATQLQCAMGASVAGTYTLNVWFPSTGIAASTAPQVTVPLMIAAMSTTSAGNLGGAKLTFTGTGFGTDAQGAATVTSGGSALCSAIARSGTSLVCTTNAGDFSGPVTLTVNGVAVNSPSSFTASSGAVPTVTSVTPSGGGRGSILRVGGTNLGLGKAYIGSAVCDVVSATATEALCILGGGTASGAQAVTITTNDAGASAAGATTFTVRLFVSGMNPARGRASGGQTVTVFGSGFHASDPSKMRVQLGGFACTVTATQVDQLTCTTPNATLDERHDVVVSLIDSATVTPVVSGTSYTYDTALTATVTGINPSSGSAAGLETVTVSGTGFSTTAIQNKVTIGGAPCQVQTATANELTCLTQPMPLSASNVVQVVINQQGKATSSAGNFNARLQIDSVSTSSVSVEGGLTVTFSGFGFYAYASSTDWRRSYAKLKVDGKDCTIIDSTAITMTCKLPAANRAKVNMPTLVQSYTLKPDATTRPVELKVNGVAATVTPTINFVAASTPTMTSVTPSGIVSPGTQLVIAGTGFAASGNIVEAGKAACTVDTESPTEVRCTVQAAAGGFGEGQVRVLVPGKGYSSSTVSCPVGQKLMCNGKCLANSQCVVADWGMDTCDDLAHLIVHDTFCHANGGTDRVGLPFKTDSGDIFDMSCPLYSCEGGDCDQALYIGGVGGRVSTCGRDPSGINIDVRPVVTSLSSAESSVGGFKPITISGNHFGTNASHVTVVANNAVCAIKTIANNQIVCETGAQVASRQEIRVYRDKVQATCANCVFTYTSTNIPRITSVAPVNVLAFLPMTVTGAGFGTNAAVVAVHVGSSGLCSPITSISDTQIICTAPQLPAGGYQVKVAPASIGGSLGFDVTYRLSVTSMSPASGSVTGGTLVTVTGTGFTANSRATFGNCPAVHQSFTGGKIVVKTGTCSGGAWVSVSENGATSRCDGACTYTFSQSSTPFVSSVSGSVPGTITIGVSQLGGAPQGDLSITAGPAACAITSYSASSIQCTMPASVGGTFRLNVYVASLGNSRQTNANDPEPSVTFPMTATAFSPSSGSLAGGQLVTIDGTGFSNTASDMKVLIGGVACTPTTSTTTQLVCKTGSVAADASGSVQVMSSHADLLASNTPATAPGTYNYQTAKTPTITAVTPNRGSSAGGTSLTVSGTGLSSAMTMKINGVTCTASAGEQAASDASGGLQYFCTTGAYQPQLTAVYPALAKNNNDGEAKATATYQYIDLWSRWTTWGNSPPPVEGDSVVISEGQLVVVDYSPPRFYLVIVMGHLMFDNSIDINFDCTYIMINYGRFTVGTPENRYLKKATITLHGDRLTPEIPVHGAKVIALRHGALDMHGEVRQPTWTRLAATAPVAANSIQVRGPVDWRVGEFIVIAPTDYEFLEAEHRMITGVTPADGQAAVVTLNLEYPLDYLHYGQRQCFDPPANTKCVDEIAEVGLLTRNIVVQGDRQTQRIGFGGTMFLMPLGADHDKYARISYVEFNQVGQQFIVGRYPVHYHVTHASNNSYVNGTSVHHSLNRAFSIHGISNNTYVNNVAYDIAGHAFFIEDGSEKYNVIHNNMVSVVKTSTSNLNTDITPANFWIVSPLNKVTNNAACGGHAYGFWISPFHPHSTGPTHSTSVCPASHKLWDISNNVAHSNRKYGLNVFRFWWPKEVECDFNSRDAPAVLTHHLSYKNHIHGVTIGNQEVGEVGSIIFDNLVSADNGFVHGDGSAYWTEKNKAANQTVGVRNSLLIALTNNNPYVRQKDRRGINLPEGDNFFSENVTFVNYDGNNYGFEPQAWAERMSLCFPWGWDALSRNIQWINSPNRINMRFHHHGVLYDEDGTLGGFPRSQIVAKSTIFDDTICQPVTVANTRRTTIACPEHYKIRRFGISKMSDIFTWQNWTIDGRWEEVPEILRSYLMTAPINRTVRIDFQWWKNPESWDWKYGGFIFLQPGERQRFETIYNETRHHVYAQFNDKVLDRNYNKSVPPLMHNQSEYSFHNETQMFTGVMVYNGSGLRSSKMMTVTAYTCPDEGCPLPPLPIPNWWKPCKPYNQTAAWTSGVVPNATNRAPLFVDSESSVCLGTGANMTKGTVCGSNATYTYHWQSLRIEGAFNFRNEHCPCGRGETVEVKLDGYMWIRNGGLLIGNETHVLSACKFRVSILRAPIGDIEATRTHSLAPWGPRGLNLESGMLFVNGEKPRPLWTRLAEPALAGTSELVLETNATTWRVGDEIAVAGTNRLHMYTETATSDSEFEESEKAVIANITGSRVVLTHPLRFTHFGGPPQRHNNITYRIGAEVINLRRMATFDGGEDDSQGPPEPPFLMGWQLNVGCTPDLYQGCAVDMSANAAGQSVGWPMGIGKPGYVQVDGALFKDVGQAALLHGGINFDGLNDQVDAGESFFRNNALDRVYNTGVFIRDTTTNMTIANNVFFNVSGDAVRVASSGNNVEGNVVVRMNMPYQVCDKVYFIFWDCRTAAFRIHSGNRVVGNVAASGPTAGFITEGDKCDMTERRFEWRDNVAHSTRDGLLVADHPAEEFMFWGEDDTVPSTCRRIGGVTAYWIGDHGVVVWYAKKDLRVQDVTVVEATVGIASLQLYPPTAQLRPTFTPTAHYRGVSLGGYWDNQTCRGADYHWKCKKSLLDSKPWCTLFHANEHQQPMGVVGMLETLFTSTETGPGKTKGEHKFRWLEMDSYATLSGQAMHSDFHFFNWDGDDECGLKNAAFHQNPYSNDTFHFHGFERTSWSGYVRNGGKFFARRTYGDTHHPADRRTPTWFLDYDNFKYGAYWPDAPNRVMVHDLDGTFTNSSNRTTIVASETITRTTRFEDLQYHGRGFAPGRLPPARDGCTWQVGSDVYHCDNRYEWVTVAIDNLAEDFMTRRPGPWVTCFGDGMVRANGHPTCQGGVVDYQSGPVMKGKAQRATLDRLTRWWFALENGGNYTLSSRGQPPVWMRFKLQNDEYLRKSVPAGVTLNLRYFGLNAKCRVGVYVNGRRLRPEVGFDYPWFQLPPKRWPSANDTSGTHYHDKFVDGQMISEETGSQGFERNVISFSLRPGDEVDLKQEPIVQINTFLSMPIDSFFNDKDTFVAAMASVLGIDESRLKFAKIVPGTTRRRQGDRSAPETELTMQIEQSLTDAELNWREAPRAGREATDLYDVYQAALNFRDRYDPGYTAGTSGRRQRRGNFNYAIRDTTVEYVQVRIPRPDISVAYGTPYVVLNISKGLPRNWQEDPNSTLIVNKSVGYILRTYGSNNSWPMNETTVSDFAVGNVYYDAETNLTRMVFVLLYENMTAAKDTLERFGRMLNDTYEPFRVAGALMPSGSSNIYPGYWVQDVEFVLNGFGHEFDGDANNDVLLGFTIGAAVALAIVAGCGIGAAVYFLHVKPKQEKEAGKAYNPVDSSPKRAVDDGAAADEEYYYEEGEGEAQPY